MKGAATTPTCVGCGSEATRHESGRYLCDSPSCHQVPGTRHQDQVGTEGGKGLYVVPGVPGVGSPAREPELLGLIRDNERGLLEPIEVELGDLPAVGMRAPCFDGGFAVVTEAMHRVAADLCLLIGLRLAVNEERPLPYSTRFCAERCGLRDHRQASRVLRALERVGVIQCVGTLKPRGRRDGTKLYEAPERGGT